MYRNGKADEGTVAQRGGGRFARRMATVGAAALPAAVTGGAGAAVAQPATSAVQPSAAGAQAARSTHVTLVNQTGAAWNRKWAGLQHGEWKANSYPAEVVSADSSASWESQSDGFATGTEGMPPTRGVPVTST
ncbi:hypothetical protein ACH4FX_28920 [Streptomyces sp. NPDC018019]|uniref:hypothetical protein n=1 Tax=Streptomyces sp. NPDC018019 TaxID=3365030 RepID=UPI0037BBAEB8